MNVDRDRLFEEIRNAFGDAARKIKKIKRDDPRNRKEYHVEDLGILLFKRRVMGFCGWKTTKTLSELTDILKEMSIVKSPEETSTFMNKIYMMGGTIPYNDNVYWLTFGYKSYKDNQRLFTITKGLSSESVGLWPGP